MKGVRIAWRYHDTRKGGLPGVVAEFWSAESTKNTKDFQSNDALDHALAASRLPDGTFLGMMRLVLTPNGEARLTVYPFSEIPEDVRPLFLRRRIGTFLEHAVIRYAQENFSKLGTPIRTIRDWGTASHERLEQHARRGNKNWEKPVPYDEYLSMLTQFKEGKTNPEHQKPAPNHATMRQRIADAWRKFRRRRYKPT